MSKPIQITVGGSGLYDPAPGQAAAIIPFLAGLEFYVEGRGVGALSYSEWERRSTGGFNLLGGATFTDADTYTIHLTGGYTLGTDLTSYTNGYNLNRVLSALFGRLGWKQPDIAGSPVIDAPNLVSKSGRLFNDGSFHPLVTISNIKSVMEEAGAADVNLNSYLTTLQNSIIMRCLNSVFDGPEIVEVVKLFERYGQNDQVINSSGQFVGYEINVANAADTACQLDAVTLYFDEAATFNLYLFKDGVIAPVKTIEVTTEAGSLSTVSLVDIVLNTGKYYFGYFQDDLGSCKAIWEQVKCWNKTLLFSASNVAAAATGSTSFNRDNRTYPGYTYGLNLEISTFKDYTRLIERKANMFDEMIGLQMAYCIMEQVLFAVRSNSTERILKDQVDRLGLQLDLTGAAPISQGPKVTGLRQRITREAEKVKGLFYPKQKPQTVNLLEC